jgi:hypothetical protein
MKANAFENRTEHLKDAVKDVAQLQTEIDALKEHQLKTLSDVREDMIEKGMCEELRTFMADERGTTPDHRTPLIGGIWDTLFEEGKLEKHGFGYNC